ncbi:MAG TPA: hypothetical protein VE996_06400 [Terriglobales bacterium]|nr:hypothetical protein [Terriglobales bacterium]
MIQGLVIAPVLVGLGWAGAVALRTWRAAADQGQAQTIAQTEPEQALGYLAAALRWRPDDADLWRERATYSGFGTPRQARRDALHALALNPRDWRAWQALGLLDFELGDLQASRRDLAKATRYDHGFASHFALGNLALVQGDQAAFQKEMAAALAIAPADRADFALRALVDHSKLGAAGLAALLPAQRPEIVAESVRFFVREGRFAAATAAWGRLHCRPYQFADCRVAALSLANALTAAAFAESQTTPPQPPRPSRSEPQLPSARELADSAMDVWNQAVAAGMLAQARISPGSVADGRFQHAWVGPAFSWRSTQAVPLETVAGPLGRGNALQVAFDGYQPDEVVLLNEFVPVLPETAYAISFRSRRTRIGSESGLTLRVLAGPNRELAALPAKLALAWDLNSATVQVPAAAALLELSFEYRRPVGQVRLHDPVQIADVELTPLSP